MVDVRGGPNCKGIGFLARGWWEERDGVEEFGRVADVLRG
jgi:hypothetical protein